jgi:IS4 transposase
MDPQRFPPTALAVLYHQRWRIETSYEEFKVLFHADVLRSKTVQNIYKGYRKKPQ